MIRRTRPLLLLAVLLAAGCASTTTLRFLDRVPEISADTDPEAEEIVLLRELRYRLLWKYPSHETEWSHHEARLLRTEAALAGAKATFRFSDESELVDLRARVIRPDGTIREVRRDEMYEETAVEDAESAVKQRTFRFPEVEVGSIVEWIAKSRSPWSVSEISGVAGREVPVRRYSVVIEGDPRFVYAMRAYNHRAKVRVEPGPGGGWRLRWEVRDLPAFRGGAFPDHPSFRRPWWHFRVKQRIYRNSGYDLLSTWEDALDGRAFRTFPEKDDPLEGVEAELDTSACEGDARCVVKAARAWLWEKAPWTGRTWHSGDRSLREALDAGGVDERERTTLLANLLVRAGLEVHLAAAHRPYASAFDPGFPSWRAYERSLLWLPPQPGLEAGLWVSPICDACAPGEVPASVAGTKAAVMTIETPFGGYRKVHVEPTPVDAPVAAPPEMTVRTEARLAADGGLTATTTRVQTGALAAEARRTARLTKKAERARFAQEVVTDLVATGRVVSAGRDRCEAGAPRCTWPIELSAPGYATAAGGRLIVPLSLLRAGNLHDVPAADRPHPTGVVEARLNEDVLRVHLPAGWRLAEAPAAWEADGGLVRASFEVKDEGEVVEVRRRLELVPGRAKTKGYRALREAMDRFMGARKAALVLVPAAPDAAP